MAGKYIIYTMGIKEINEAVQKILFEKGYRWLASGEKIQHTNFGIVINYFLGDKFDGHLVNMDAPPESDTWKSFKELTFRELCELPPVHDEGELAQKIYKIIEEYFFSKFNEYEIDFIRGQIKEQNWCKIRQKVEEKLGLGLSDAET